MHAGEQQEGAVSSYFDFGVGLQIILRFLQTNGLFYTSCHALQPS